MTKYNANRAGFDEYLEYCGFTRQLGHKHWGAKRWSEI